MALSADIRRVVTTVDKNDKAVVLIDGATPHKKVRPHAQTVSRLLWVTDQTPADLSGTRDRAAIDIGIMPPAGGSVFRVVDFPPETEEMKKLAEKMPGGGLPPTMPNLPQNFPGGLPGLPGLGGPKLPPGLPGFGKKK